MGIGRLSRSVEVHRNIFLPLLNFASHEFMLGRGLGHPVSFQAVWRAQHKLHGTDGSLHYIWRSVFLWGRRRNFEWLERFPTGSHGYPDA